MKSLALKYALFAVAATVANLAAQRSVLAINNGTTYFLIALAIGTGVGLVVKYVLDSLWIFNQFDKDINKNARRFVLYTTTGVLTTAIFWASEAFFWFTTGNQTMREIGAIGGLAIGYIIKFWLDRRYVFTSLSPQPDLATPESP